MGGSGGRASSSWGSPADLRAKALEGLAAQEKSVEINTILADALKRFNNRDVELVRERLDEIAEALSEVTVDIDRILFGGSVAKHTYVDGLSDVDALVVVSADSAQPSDLLSRFADYLRQKLASSGIIEISSGNLAVTVKYTDGSEIQLLPAVERDGRTSIASSDGTTWRQIRPHKFAEKLTEVNARNANAVIPAIKLAKNVLDKHLADRQKLGGYHLEAIAVDAFRSYSGRRDHASMLHALIEHASKAVLRPTGDITGQSVHVDAHLGSAHSAERVSLSSALQGVLATLKTASAADYKVMFDDE